MHNQSKIKSILIKFILFIIVIYNFNFPILAQNVNNTQSAKTSITRYPNYSTIYVGDDKYETFNRKMFNINKNLNKFIAKPVHIIWASIMPQYGMDRIKNAYNNIEYPKRLASCIIQKDKVGIKNETIRFLTNSTIGLGGLFDPAEKLFNIKSTEENMEQALCKCKMKSGSYMVIPFLSACTPRTLCGRTLEAALDPSAYIATPITAIVKFGLMVNRTSYMQPLAKMLESTYADPYDIQKKLFGIENYIKNENLNRQDLLSNKKETNDNKNQELLNDEKILLANNDIKSPLEQDGLNDINITGGAANINNLGLNNTKINSDLIFADYNSQSPIIDAMKTSFFDDENINKSIWNELSVWNRSFAKRIKSDEINIEEGRDNYKFYYILQKNNDAPLMILYPSVGENANTHHSIVFAKMFYDEGFSVAMIGNHFQWQFVKSMPKNYCPGIPQQDVIFVRNVTQRVLNNLEEKNKQPFSKKILLGTSFGAFSALFVADKENEENILNIDKYIAVSPPIELVYALRELDKYSEIFSQNPNEIKEKTAIAVAKILQLSKQKDKLGKEIDVLPFSEEEGKMITAFLLRQKLSDLIYTVEGVCCNKKTNIYDTINNLSFKDYAMKYLIKEPSKNLNDINFQTSLYSISNYLANNNNYKIYHSIDDYFTNKEQIQNLKNIAKSNFICLNCGSHLGFLYRDEFIKHLKNEVKN